MVTAVSSRITIKVNKNVYPVGITGMHSIRILSELSLFVIFCSDIEEIVPNVRDGSTIRNF